MPTPTSASYMPLAALHDDVRAVLEPNFDTVLRAVETAVRHARDTRLKARLVGLQRSLYNTPRLPAGIEFAVSGDQFKEQWNGTVLARWDPQGWAMLRWSKINGPDYDLDGTPCDLPADDGVVTYVEVAEHGRRSGVATALLARACIESGSLLASTLATDDGGAWGARARERLAAARLLPDDLQLVGFALQVASQWGEGLAPPGTPRGGYQHLARRLATTLAAPELGGRSNRLGRA